MNKLTAFFVVGFALSFSGNIFGKPVCKQAIAKVISAQGKVLVQVFGAEHWQAIAKDDQVCPGDTLRTTKWSRTTIVFSNKNIVTLDQNTTLNFPAPQEQTVSWLIKVFEGVSFFRSRETQKLHVQTPFINAVHEGTEFIVAVGKDKAEITVLDGKVAAENKNAKISINKGETGIAETGKMPVVRALTIKPQDAVQWSLYYPPIIDFSHSEQQTGDGLLVPALTAYQQGDVETALNTLAEIPAANSNPRILNLQAALLLSVGRIDEVEPLIQRVQQLAPGNSDALALQAVIAVAVNRQQQALELANKAVGVKADSAVAKIAQSYAYQSLFDIDQALKATEEATRLAPNNALAWARLAELQLSKGYLDVAMASAKKAQTLNPKHARTQTVLGFVNLAETGINDAKRAFGQAISLDSSDPLARLGFGLALIRQGEVEAGRDELETAVNLDPNNAITRSYLGKAYYELRNKDYAGKEFEIAKEMDPKDPTPYFYDAILKQTTNRSVAAFRDMQKAKELNDNRAVYRSSLLLDKDLAARSAAQGRIYNELGFQQQGLLEGWQSVNKDNANYSAHRLLADNYAVLPRHELARVSELLQSQLLQPVNITPIQPNLGESNLFILNGLGPSDLSFNEFNPLFEYNRFALQASALYGSNDTVGDNVTVSGLHDDMSFSLGQFHYETDGFRDNNFLKKDLYNAFVQGRVSEALNLQAEYRHEERENGDLALNFDPANFSKEFNEHRDLDSYRVGGNYTISPHNSLIGSLTYQDVKIDQRSVELIDLLGDGSLLFPDIFKTRTHRNGFIGELQHNYAADHFSLINGFGHIDQDLMQISTSSTGTSNTSQTKLSRTNFYNYSKIYPSKNLTATVGLSVDFYQNGEQSRTPLNPKLGVEWHPSASTTFRMAGFRTLSVGRAFNQTLEPTQVAGFNQFFDDIDGTYSWRYGIGLDHRFSPDIAAGLEYSERKLYIPSYSYSVDRSEQLGRAYVNVTPHEFLALGAEYYFERINQPNRPITGDNALSGGLFDKVETHRIPLSVSFIHPSGFTFKVKNSFVHQSGLFQNQNSLQSAYGKSDFFVVDLSLGYRLPKRYGMVNLGINNLFNDKFSYQNTNINEPVLAPDRTLFSRVTLAY